MQQPGDADGNDFLAWQRGLGTTNARLLDGDFDGNGATDGNDLPRWESLFGIGPSPSAPAAVPEPTSWLLLVILTGLATLATRRG